MGVERKRKHQSRRRKRRSGSRRGRGRCRSSLNIYNLPRQDAEETGFFARTMEKEAEVNNALSASDKKDEGLNLYLELLKESEKKELLPSLKRHFSNTLFYMKSIHDQVLLISMVVECHRILHRKALQVWDT
ncbi:hypothetical protein SUGI_0886220 [Cryptomeria japonica]|nr:hypothetical protein SUGI_0886220 [Cryptomeria japonica]